jgi:hypothetical protein
MNGMTGDQGLSVRRVTDAHGHSWRIGTHAEVAWITQGTSTSLTITSAIPPVFDAYATVVLPDCSEDQERHVHGGDQGPSGRHEQGAVQGGQPDPHGRAPQFADRCHVASASLSRLAPLARHTVAGPGNRLDERRGPELGAKRLFKDGAAGTALELVESREVGPDVLLLIYRPASAEAGSVPAS